MTGFDGIRAAIDAKLTTVVQPVVEKGRQAGRMLLNPARKTAGPADRAADDLPGRQHHRATRRV